jgi:hypothetical protein
VWISRKKLVELQLAEYRLGFRHGFEVGRNQLLRTLAARTRSKNAPPPPQVVVAPPVPRGNV